MTVAVFYSFKKSSEVISMLKKNLSDEYLFYSVYSWIILKLLSRTKEMWNYVNSAVYDGT